LTLLNNVISFQAGSTTTGGPNGAVEGWTIFGSNTSGTLGATQIDTCTNSSPADTHCENPISDIGFTGGFKFLDITSIGTGGGNILLAHLDANVAVPGPIVGAGLPGLVAACAGLVAADELRAGWLSTASTLFVAARTAGWLRTHRKVRSRATQIQAVFPARQSKAGVPKRLACPTRRTPRGGELAGGARSARQSGRRKPDDGCGWQITARQSTVKQASFDAMASAPPG
jgi:hypothetical protein